MISGVRRSGKSSLLSWFSLRYKYFRYINFDDDCLRDFSLADFPSLVLVFETISPGKQVIFIDEVRNIARWECFFRRTHDEGHNVFQTVSNTNLLPVEPGTHPAWHYVRPRLTRSPSGEVCQFRQIPAARNTEHNKVTDYREILPILLFFQ